LGEAFDDQRLDTEACQHLCSGAAGITLFDRSGQRTFGAGREAAGIGSGGTGKKSWGKDQLIAGTEGMTSGRDFGGDNRRGQTTTAETGPGRWYCLNLATQIAHIDA